MITLDTEICICNGVTIGELAECIKRNNFTKLEEVIDNDDCPVGNKCESCIDEGFNNDGINIPMVLNMVEKNSLPEK